MENNEQTPADTANQPDPENLKLRIHHAPRNERYEMGKQLRKTCPRSSHETWKAPVNRQDPLDLLLTSEEGRIPDLLPLRHGRMARSPFTFYRGAAFNMAADLANTPVSGMFVQACGDAHLCNFGGFATPERNIIFSINDLDETLPAPWEWDVKRLAASFVVASRNNNLSESVAREAVLECVRSYRMNMAAYSEMKILELWHISLRWGPVRDPVRPLPRTFAWWLLARRPTDRSSALRRSMGSSASNPRSGWSAAQALFRSRTPRTRPALWPGPCATPPSCSGP